MSQSAVAKVNTDARVGRSVEDRTNRSHRAPITTREIAEAVSCAAEQIRATGRGIETSTDFEAVWAEVVETSKGRVNKESSPHHSDLNAGDACYVVVRGDDGEGAIEGFAAIRHFRLGHDNLAVHLTRQYRRIYGNGQEAIDHDRLADVIFSISGNVAQVSDIFVEKNARALLFKNKGQSKRHNKDRFSAQSLMAFAYGVARLDHDPDHVFGFTKARDAGRGLTTRYLATNTYPNAITWLVPTPNRRHDDYFLHMDRQSIGHVLRHFLSEASSVQRTS